MTYLFQLIDLPTEDLAKSGTSATMKLKSPDGYMIAMMHPMTEGSPEGKTRILLCMVEQPRVIPAGIVR